MRVDLDTRMAEAVTVVHRPDVDADWWTSTTYPSCFWRVNRVRTVGADGTVAEADVLEVQVPEDQGLGDVSRGDWLVRGSLDFEGTTAELQAVLPSGSRRVRAVDDRTGGLSGISGPVARWASVTLIEGA